MSALYISGWCLDLNNPIVPIELDIFFLGALLGSTKTTNLRKDLTTIFKFPVNRGFQFDLTRISHQAAKAALVELQAVLTAAPGRPLAVADLVSVSPTGRPDERLACGSTGSLSPEDAVALCQQWKAMLAVDHHNRHVETVEAALREVLTPESDQRTDEGVRIIAFYLPQYHPIPENDAWWGPGFTEWTNVATAKPLFDGHNQPRLPSELGFYDLRAVETQHAQAKLARDHHISAFCYYYYWFEGKTVLTLPIEQHVSANVDLDFCLCWANENWSRRWDGSEAEVLLEQTHNPTHDREFFASILPYLQHPRYVRVDGLPLVMVYRVSLLRDPTTTFAQWRDQAAAAGLPGLHISVAETFGTTSCHPYGADSTCQFPPHGINVEEITGTLASPETRFGGKIYDYEHVVASQLAAAPVVHRRFRTAMPGWDNTARRGRMGNVFHGATPELFETWMSKLCLDASQEAQGGTQLVFINAWNEWAEGAHLEPDRRFGRQNLQAVANAWAVAQAEAAVDSNTSSLVAENQRLRRANRLLGSVLEARSHLLAAAPPVFLQLEPNFGIRLRTADWGFLQIDSLNGVLAADKLVLVRRRFGVTVHGWFAARTTTPDKALTVFLALLPETPSAETGLGPVYFAAVSQRTSRADVEAIYAADTCSPLPGFGGSFDVSGVEYGYYRFGLIIPSTHSGSEASVLRSSSTIILGK
ncbi:MAG: glycoside hydrolase family 99-like domain-containing protein [Alphaproteobacteria bacterium]|nr:glycoside hydrolase family 99-like domain-containing protein [Alphaproteobacteria bacterium]